MRLREIRKNAGMTQKKVCSLLNCSEAVYSRYEQGTRGIDYNILLNLSAIFNVSVDYILENDKYAIESHPEEHLNPTDALILKQFHKADQFDQIAVLRILGIKEKVGTENLKTAK